MCVQLGKEWSQDPHRSFFLSIDDFCTTLSKSSLGKEDRAAFIPADRKLAS